MSDLSSLQTTCLICGNRCIEDVQNNGYQYWKCCNCHTSQLLPQPSTDALDAFYDNFHNALQGGSYDEFEGRAQADFDCKAALAASYMHSQHGKLLDVACGKGFFVKICNRFKIQAKGIDVSPSAISYARNNLGVDAVCGKVEDHCNKNGFNGEFDVVTMWAGIEHVPDPLHVIKSIHACLKSGGYFLMDTGLGSVFAEKFLTGHSQWYSAPEHLFVFSRDGLRILMDKAGFEIVSINDNFERNLIRRIARSARHAYICIVTGLLIRPILGRNAYRSTRSQTKWPIGRLVQVVCKK